MTGEYNLETHLFLFEGAEKDLAFIEYQMWDVIGTHGDQYQMLPEEKEDVAWSGHACLTRAIPLPPHIPLSSWGPLFPPTYSFNKNVDLPGFYLTNLYLKIIQSN